MVSIAIWLVCSFDKCHRNPYLGYVIERVLLAYFVWVIFFCNRLSFDTRCTEHSNIGKEHCVLLCPTNYCRQEILTPVTQGIYNINRSFFIPTSQHYMDISLLCYRNNWIYTSLVHKFPSLVRPPWRVYLRAITLRHIASSGLIPQFQVPPRQQIFQYFDNLVCLCWLYEAFLHLMHNS